MKTYLVYGSPNCRKVLATINHLRTEVDIEYIQFEKGDLQTPEFGDLNPNRLVPVLVDGSYKLWESNAICQYLADMDEQGKLFPKSPQERANVSRWQFWEQAHFNMGSGMILMETIFKPIFMGQSADQTKIEEGKEKFHRFAQVLDDHLATHSFVAGDNLTIADFSVACQSDHWEVGGVPFQSYKNIITWLERMQDFESWTSSRMVDEEMLKKVAAG